MTAVVTAPDAPATAADEGAPGMADSASAEVSAAVPAELARIRERLSQATMRAELDAALADARRIADANPLLVEAQLVTGSIAYRMSRWQDAVTYFGRVDLTAGEPEHQFYYAVALYEAGNRAAAEEMLERCLPLLERTSFVESYTAKILN